MECKFVVGQKVVCINNSILPEWINKFPHCRHVGDHLTEGQTYTIRWIGEHPYPEYRISGICVRLEEVRIDEFVLKDSPVAAKRFVPLQERKTDISLLERLLDPKNHEILEDA